MPTRLSCLWLPVVLVVAFAIYCAWPVGQALQTRALSAGAPGAEPPADRADKPTSAASGQPSTETTPSPPAPTPAPAPMLPVPADSATGAGTTSQGSGSEAGDDGRGTPSWLEGQDTGDDLSGEATDTAQGTDYGTSDTGQGTDYGTSDTGQGTDYGGDTSAWGRRAGAGDSAAPSWQQEPDYGATDTTTDTGTTSYDATTDTAASSETARAFHLFDGFENGNSWAVESAADHAELSTDTERLTEGQKSLKAAFKAFGKGNFELRREVSLDLSDATRLVVDVYNEAGPMDLVLGLRAGYDTTLFTSGPKPLQTGWNKQVDFPLKELASNAASAWGSSWSWSRDSVTRVSLIFQERGEKEGTVHVDNLRFDQAASVIGAKIKPELRTVTASARAVERYETIELAVDFQADFQDFFKRSEVDVFAAFFSPSGKRLDVKGFVCDVDEAEAAPTWKVRFTPTEVGLWRYDVTVKDAGGQVTSQTYQFLCRRQADHRGFIRIAKNDPRYFEFDDGSFYYPLGQNVCWASNYDYYLGQIQKYGGNYIRVWLCPWNLQLEDPTEPGKYDLRTANALDLLLEQCRNRGVYVQLVLRYHGMHDATWSTNPYNTANGGPCTWAGDFFTDLKARELHKQFLDYAVARWGHSTAIFAWELWNEADLARSDREADLVAWHKEMAAYIKQIDVHRHLVTTSVSNATRNFKLFELPEIDFVPVHFYARDVAKHVHDSYTRFRALRKPVFIGEFSAGYKPADDLDDHQGTHLHAGLWLTLVTPLAGNAMPWWWDTYVDKNKLYPHWAAVARLAAGVDRRGREFELLRSTTRLSDDATASLQGIVAPDEALLWVYDPARIGNPDHTDRPLLFEERPMSLRGMLGGDFRVEVWDTYDGTILRTTQATSNDGTLSFVLPKCNRDIAVKITKVRGGKDVPRLEW